MMDTFVYLERATMQWLVQRYQRRTLRRAVRAAYVTFARTYPNWVAALFDEHFIHTHMLPALHHAAERGETVTARQIADLWVRQVSILPTLRQKHSARVIPVATHFLCMVADELAATQVGPHPTQLVETAVG
jgi:hypothetical protein